MNTFAAIIPAAGLSTRMGRFKPLLPLGKDIVLSRCVALFKKNNISRVYVVTGNRAEDVAAAAEQAKAVPVHNPDYEQGMFSSMLTGVAALPDDIEAFMVLPVDIPLLRPETVARLVDEYRHTKPDILYPRFRKERGHPPVISSRLLPAILEHDGNGGLRAVLDRYESGARDLDVADFGTVHDLDRPADYTLACGLADARYPCRAECEQLWDMYSLPQGTRAHCRAVARVADALCSALNRQRPADQALCSGLALGAALTHDLAKGLRNHEKIGADRLRTHGFHAAAAIVETHSDMSPETERPITEAGVVFLADKFVQGNSFVTLEERYRAKMDRFGHDPDAANAITARLKRVLEICSRLDQEMKNSAEILAREVLV